MPSLGVWGPALVRGCVLAWAAGAGAAWAAPSGLYFGADLGGAMPGELSSTRINVGVPTNCDQWLGAATLNDGTMVPLPAAQCQPRALPASPSDFDLDMGVFGAVQVGYAFDALRVEAELFRRRQTGERLPLVVPDDPKQAEFTERSEAIGDVVGDGFFANAYRDLGTRGAGGKFKPFVGIGVGWMSLDIDYAATSIRNADPAALLALGRNPNAAGVLSRADDTLSDRLAGYQVLAGFDYALGVRRALSVKVRYANLFDDFEDDGKAWKPLRGHESTVAPGGAPIRYGIETDDLGFWAITVGLKFHPK